jgi:hypothetical protein
MFENRVLRRIFGPEIERKMQRGKRIFHYEELHNLCSSPNIIRVIRQGGWHGQSM